MLFGSSIHPSADSNPIKLDGTQSSWAEGELLESYTLNLTYATVMNNFRKNITREEFCTLVIKLYEQLTGQKALGGSNPFTDTNNEEIIKAYHLGIVKGVSATNFAPYNLITRQEICVMIHRALKVSLSGIKETYLGEFPFTDKSDIASWAIDSVRFAYGNGIMKGVGDNKIAPLQNTTREQGIILIKRTFESFRNTGVLDPTELLAKDTSGFISTDYKRPLMESPIANYRDMEGGNLFFPKYDERVELFVSSGETKPTLKPNTNYIYNLTKTSTLQKNTYTNATMSAFIDKEGSSKRWFYFQIKNPVDVGKVIWQVSSVPFNGFEQNWKYPTGLLASGEVGITSNEFQIDFSTIKLTSLEKGMIALSTGFIDFKPINTDLYLRSSGYKPITSNRDVYYIRVIPVNKLGSPVGDPGKGIAVIYGEKVPEKSYNTKISSDFNLWIPDGSGGFGSGEFPNNPKYKTVFRVEPKSVNEWLFHFRDIDINTRKIALQFSTEMFPTSGGGWPDTPNIIYSKEYTLPITIINNQYPNTVMVDVSKFIKPANEMKQGDLIKYYVRGITLSDSITPGEYTISYSSPVTMEYGFGTPVKYYSDDPYRSAEKLNYSLPTINIVKYSKVKWPSKDYMEHYYVYRAPKWDEIKSKFKNTQTGEILYPYNIAKDYYDNLGIKTEKEYEEKIIPRVLSIGTTVHIPKPVEKDKEWYQQLFEGVVKFFNDLAYIVKTIVNQVSNAYARLKNELIMFVVNLCPVDSLKGYFKTALEAWVNYGLMWLGIPPTLPNFDQLAEMSMDYYVKVVLTEAGIPENEWTEQALKDLTVEMGKQINQAAYYADENPISAPFLKLDPEYMYKPAYVDIELKNSTIKPTIPGMIELNVTFEMDYSNMNNPIYPLNLSSYSNYSYSSDAGWSDSMKYREHFEQGLNGYSVNYSQGYRSVYDVFVPMKKVKVPTLKGGQSTTIRVYLEPFRQGTFTRYPGAHYVTTVDFENMYFNNGNKLFTYFNVNGIFPTAEEFLLNNSNIFYLDPETNYVFYNETYVKTSERIQKPVSIDWLK